MSRSLLGGREHQITHVNVDIEQMVFKGQMNQIFEFFVFQSNVMIKG